MSKVVRTWCGIGLILVGVLAGLYVGAWVMFVGGIVQIVNAVKATPIEAQGIAVGILRVVFAWVAGWLAAVLIVGPGYLMLED